MIMMVTVISWDVTQLDPLPNVFDAKTTPSVWFLVALERAVVIAPS